MPEAEFKVQGVQYFVRDGVARISSRNMSVHDILADATVRELKLDHTYKARPKEGVFKDVFKDAPEGYNYYAR